MDDLNLVDVEWEDDYYESEYKTFDEWKAYIESKIMVCHTVGYMVYNSPERIGLLNNLDADGAMHLVVIPKGVIRSIRYLVETSHQVYVAS